MASDCSDEDSRSSMVSAFSNFADEGSVSSTVSAWSSGSSGYDEFDLTKAATAVKPLVDSARKDS
jgi:hypothetical protein